MPHRLRAINYRVLATLLVVGIPVLLLGSFFVIEHGRAELRDAFGLTLAQRAEQSAAAIDAYVYRRIVDVSLLARVPDVRAIAARARPAASATEMADLDRRFSAIDLKAPMVVEVLGNAASRYFTDITREDPIYRELLLTDRDGRLVAASNLTSDYNQADEEWWKRVMAGAGRGEATVSDVRWDDSARTYAMEIAVPVPGRRRTARRRPQGGGRHPRDAGVGGRHRAGQRRRRDGRAPQRVGGVQPRRGGPAGPVLRGGRLACRARVAGAGGRPVTVLVQRAVARRRGPADWGGHQPVGGNYPHLPWAVVTWEAEGRALAPVNSLFRSLLVVLAATLLGVLALAFWFSMKLAAMPLETEMALVPHPHIARVAEEETV